MRQPWTGDQAYTELGGTVESGERHSRAQALRLRAIASGVSTAFALLRF